MEMEVRPSPFCTFLGSCSRTNHTSESGRRSCC
uniref:Uncharacterized protein n=1 Tax=Arundo donax TaxID=35708 RepID=A0A0A9B8E8_ARUDO